MLLERLTSPRPSSRSGSKRLAARLAARWLVVAVVLWISAVGLAVGAESPPARGHIFLPPTRGATVLSTHIDAQARYIAAVGDFLESRAIARRIEADAFDREMDNALKWVETYFERLANWRKPPRRSNRPSPPGTPCPDGPKPSASVRSWPAPRPPTSKP